MSAVCVAIAELRIRQRWWWPVYLNTLFFFCWTFGLEPEWRRVYLWFLRAMIIEMRILGGPWERVSMKVLLK